MSDQTPKKRTLKVRVNDAIAARGGAFTCPFTKKTIGADPIDVEDNKFIRSKLTTDEIVIVD